jgi:hypothetical protein
MKTRIRLVGAQSDLLPEGTLALDGGGEAIERDTDVAYGAVMASVIADTADEAADAASRLDLRLGVTAPLPFQDIRFTSDYLHIGLGAGTRF